MLYARGRNRATALAIGGGWLLVIVADLAIVPFVAPRQVVPALGLGTSFGLTVSGIALLVLVRARARARRAARGAAGVPRRAGRGVAGAAVGLGAGAALSASPGFFVNVGMSVLVTLVVIAVFAAVVGSLDGGDLRAALARLRARPS